MGRRTMICSRTGALALRLRSRSTRAIRSNSTPATESRPARATATSFTASRGSIAGAAESNRDGHAPVLRALRSAFVTLPRTLAL